MDNLQLWQSVEKTDLEYTKQVNQRGGYTAIDPAYQARVATQKFGPYGLTWGLQESCFDTSLFDATGMVIHRATFFYVLDGALASFPIHNAIKPMTGSGDKVRADEDWCKKVETNTISKALSRLGFNADVFLGLFEDAEYKELLATEQAIEKAEDKEAVIVEKKSELKKYVTKQLDMIQELGASNATNGVAKVAIRHLERQKMIPTLTEIAERGIQAIKDAKETADKQPTQESKK